MRDKVCRAALFTAGAVLVATGCAPKSPDHAVWSDQARHALTGAQSEVATAELVLRQQRSGKLQQNYQQVVLIDSEEAIGRTAESFTSVQPPAVDDPRNRRISTSLSDASDAVSEARIAVVREDTSEYPKLLEDLGKARDDLASRLAELNR
jgi:hypothetical protein